MTRVSRQSLLLLGFISFQQPSVATQTSKVTLEEAKTFAIANNFEVIALRREVEEMQAKARRARSPFYPKLGLAGGADTQMKGNGNEGAAVGYLYGSYNLFSGFEDTYKADIANYEVEKAEIRLRKAELGVGLEVERLFHLYLFNKFSLELLKRALDANELHRKMAKNRKASGLASDADVIEFDLRDSILKSDVSEKEVQLEESRVNLKRLLGEEIGAKIEPVGKLQHQHIKGSLMDYISRIKGESENVLVTTRELLIATTESKMWRSKWFPKVDFEMKAGFLPLENRPDSTSGTGKETSALINGLVIAKLDLFSGFDNFWERRESESKRLKLESRLKQFILAAVTQMEIAYRKLKATEVRVHLEEQNEERATKYYNSVLSEYKRGVKNSSDLKNAAEGLYNSTLRSEGFKYDFLSQRIELEKALGGPVSVEVLPDRSKVGHE